MTRKLLLIAGVAGVALMAPAAAHAGRPGDAQQTQDRKADRQAQRADRQAQRAERPQQAQQPQRVERPQRMERVQVERSRQRAEPVARPQRFESPQRAERVRMMRAERPQQVERQRVLRAAPLARPERQRFERQAIHAERQPMRELRRAQAERRVAPATLDRREMRHIDRGAAVTSRFVPRQIQSAAPLLAAREMRPMRPFRALAGNRRAVSIGERIDRNLALARVPQTYATRYVDTPDYYYRYDDDYGRIYRIDRGDGIVRSMIPLFGGYGAGDPWPSTYASSYVPTGYQGYYYDTPDYYYRNDGNGIYQVDGSTQLITALVALLTGQNLGVGQMLPSSYDVYNVPDAYRGSYVDSNDAWYRYNDGSIYQVDPYSRRIEASYPMYGGDYYEVGSPWPAAYPDYNVPYGYRSLYADTPQYQYRYANNGIYQVNPTNQLITALVALVSGQQLGVGQQMPSNYDVYNVPMAYRDRYADTNSDWYRYADGYVYQVDPRTGLIEEAIPVYG